MSELRLHLFGSPQVWPARQQLTFSTHKECDVA
jgi:hypothetical protein